MSDSRLNKTDDQAFEILKAKYNESQRKLGAALLAETNAMDKVVDLEDANEALLIKLNNALFQVNRQTHLISGMHQIIIKAGVGGGMTQDEVCAAFTELKRKVFGEATDE